MTQWPCDVSNHQIDWQPGQCWLPVSLFEARAWWSGVLWLCNCFLKCKIGIATRPSYQSICRWCHKVVGSWQLCYSAEERTYNWAAAAGNCSFCFNIVYREAYICIIRSYVFFVALFDVWQFRSQWLKLLLLLPAAVANLTSRVVHRHRLRHASPDVDSFVNVSPILTPIDRFTVLGR